MRRLSFLAGLLAVSLGTLTNAEDDMLPKADGYLGIWYMNQPSKDEYKYKYSGGFATYPQQHHPIAIYSEAANKTFFVFGGRPRDKNTLLHMVSYFDHETGTVPRPTILLDKQTTDAHDNPTLSIDEDGHLWIFSNAHGTSRPSFIHRSKEPFDIDSFEKVVETNFSYGQPWSIPGQGFLFLHTLSAPGRGLTWATSPDGREWTDPQPLASMEMGHYQVSWRRGNRFGTAFNYHPRPVGLNARTNLYYVQTEDAGRTWTTVEGDPVETPLTDPEHPSLVHDYQSEDRLVYLKDLNYDADGHPVILYLTSGGYESGPKNDPRGYHTARWTGAEWIIRDAPKTDHNYDHGSLSIEPDGTWRLIAPTDPGPQPYGTGGEVVLWTSQDQGKTWDRIKALTPESEWNHTYVRRPLDAHPDFYAIWADGDAFAPSGSQLYFTNKDGDKVWRLPETMTEDSVEPEVAW
ncbi:BNR-4 repeat-containing protein [soil metagenome]